MIRFLQKLRALSFIHRWNFHPRVRQENVAEHSFWVAIYAMALGKYMNLTRETLNEVALAALLHDAEESITGDLPSLVKRYVDWEPVKQKAQAELFDGTENADNFLRFHLKAEDTALVKAADIMSALAYAHEEVEMNNKFFVKIKRELIGSLIRLANKEGGMLSHAIFRLLDDLGFDKAEGTTLHVEMSHF